MAREGGGTIIFLNVNLRGKLSQHFLLRLEGVTRTLPETIVLNSSKRKFKSKR